MAVLPPGAYCFLRETTATAAGSAASVPGAGCPRQRFKSRHLAGVVPASDDGMHGLYAIPHDTGRGVGWREPLNGAEGAGAGYGSAVSGSRERGQLQWRGDIAHPAELEATGWEAPFQKQVIYQGKEVYCD